MDSPFHAICTPIHIRMKAMIRSSPWTVAGEMALINFGA
jgi:hypothetical protein